MTKPTRVALDPFGDQDVTTQLDSWAAALEMAVATLNRTLIEVKKFSGKELSDDERDGTAAGDGRS